MDSEPMAPNSTLARFLYDAALRGSRSANKLLIAEVALSLKACGLSSGDVLRSVRWTSSTEDELIDMAISSRPRLRRRDERVAYELHRMIVLKLPEYEHAIRHQARSNLRAMRLKKRSDVATEWLGEWDRLLGSPLDILMKGLLDDGELGSEMRQLSPFAGALTDDERLLAIRKAQEVAAF